MPVERAISFLSENIPMVMPVSLLTWHDESDLDMALVSRVNPNQVCSRFPTDWVDGLNVQFVYR